MSRYYQILKLAEAARDLFPDKSGLSLANAGKEVLGQVAPEITVKPHMVGRTATATPSFNSVMSGVSKTSDPEDVIAQVIAKSGVPEQFNMSPDFYLGAVRGMRNQLRQGLETGQANQRVADTLLQIREPSYTPSVRVTEAVAVPQQTTVYRDYPAAKVNYDANNVLATISPNASVSSYAKAVSDPWAGSQAPRIYYTRESRELTPGADKVVMGASLDRAPVVISGNYTNTSPTTNVLDSLVDAVKTEAPAPVASARPMLMGTTEPVYRTPPASVVVSSEPFAQGFADAQNKIDAYRYASKIIDYLKSPINVGGMGALAAGALFDPDARSDNKALVGGYQYNTQY